MPFHATGQIQSKRTILSRLDQNNVNHTYATLAHHRYYTPLNTLRLLIVFHDLRMVTYTQMLQNDNVFIIAKSCIGCFQSFSPKMGGYSVNHTRFHTVSFFIACRVSKSLITIYFYIEMYFQI